MSKVLVIGCGGVASVAISKCCQDVYKRQVWRSTITAWPSSHFTMAGTPACMWQTTTMLIAALLYDRKFE